MNRRSLLKLLTALPGLVPAIGWAKLLADSFPDSAISYPTRECSLVLLVQESSSRRFNKYTPIQG